MEQFGRTAIRARIGRRVALRVALTGAASLAGGAVLAACGAGESPTATAPQATRPAPTVALVTPAAPIAGGTATPPATASPPAPTAAPVAPAATTAPTTGAASVAPATAAPQATMGTASGANTAASTEGKIPSPRPDLGVPDAFTRIPPLRRQANAGNLNLGTVTASLISYDPPLTPREQNLYWQELEKRLGIRYDVAITPSGSYDEKITTMTAAGNLPELTFLTPPPGYQRTLLQGAFTDLTEFLTGDALKQYPSLAAFPPSIWKNASVNGKVFGVPRPRVRVGQIMYYRKDWADKLGVAAPRTADDMANYLVGVSKRDPDGNGAADTYGLGGFVGNFGMDLFAMAFRAPNGWRQNPDGTLTAALETPEFRQALEAARRLWEQGGYHPDSANITSAQIADLLVAGKIGAYPGGGIAGIWGTGGVRDKAKKLNPQADIVAWTPPAFDGGKRAQYTAIGFFGYTGIPAKYGRDKGRVRELLRVLDYLASPIDTEEGFFIANGVAGVHHTVENGQVKRLDRLTAETGGKSGTTGVLAGLTNSPPVSFYDVPGESELVQGKMLELLTIGVDDPTWGLYAPTAGSKDAELTDLRNNYTVGIITGREPLSAYDMWVREWRSRGGDQIRREYEMALKG